jgi:hypothetical protein
MVIRLVGFLLVLCLAAPAWAASVVQSTTCSSGTCVLNGVTAGNTLILVQSFYRNTTTGAALATPTDSAGTFSASLTPTPGLFLSAHDTGLGVFHELNAASGTPIVTPNNTTAWYASLLEVSGLVSASVVNVTASDTSTQTQHNSQVTGTTSATAQPKEMVIIAFASASSPGVSNLALTDPVSGFTAIQKVNDKASEIGAMHSYKFTTTTGTQSAQFDFTDRSSNHRSQGGIATC